MKVKSLIYEAVVLYVRGECYVEGLVYGIASGEISDGDRLTTHDLRKVWIHNDGIGLLDSQGNEFLIVSLDETHPSALDSLHHLFAFAYLNQGKLADG